MNKELDYFWIPKIDNSTLFEAAYQRLAEDGCICIFPEGTSHDRTDFLTLKAGIALMTLGAMSERKCKNVKILPVGLNYFKREQFRSEVIIEFGKPFEVPMEWAEEYKVNKRDSTEKLLKEIASRMKAVTLTAPSYNDLRSLHFFRRLYVPSNIHLTSTQYSELCKRFSRSYEKLKDKADTKELVAKVQIYINELEVTGINDHEVKHIDFSYVWMVRKTITYFILFHVFLAFCLPAILILTPFGIFIKIKAEKERLIAKAKNPNKIEALDVVGSVKIQYTIMCLPFIFLLWAILFFYYFDKHFNYYCNLGFFTTLLLSAVIFPIYLYLSAKMLDRIFFYIQTMLSRFLYFINPNKIIKLINTREKLSKDVLDYVNNNLIEADPNYAEERILFKKENESGVTEKEILMKRNMLRKGNKEIKDELECVLEDEDNNKIN